MDRVQHGLDIIYLDIDNLDTGHIQADAEWLYHDHTDAVSACAGVWCWCDVTACWWLVMARLRRIVFRYYHPPPFDVIDQYLTFLTQRTIFHQISSFIKPKTQHPQYLSDAHATLRDLSIIFDPPLEYLSWRILQYRNVAMLSEIL